MEFSQTDPKKITPLGAHKTIVLRGVRGLVIFNISQLSFKVKSFFILPQPARS